MAVIHRSDMQPSVDDIAAAAGIAIVFEEKNVTINELFWERHSGTRFGVQVNLCVCANRLLKSYRDHLTSKDSINVNLDCNFGITTSSANVNCGSVEDFRCYFSTYQGLDHSRFRARIK